MIEREILFYLRDVGKEVSYEELKRDVRFNNQIVHFHLRNLVDNGKIKKIQRGDTFFYSIVLK